MYNALFIAQTIAVIVCFAAVTVMAFNKTSSYSNIILVTFVCGFVQNAGYLQEFMATTAEEAMIAIRGEYIGGAFEICLLTFFVFKYCGHEFKLPLKYALLFEGVVVLFGVWTWQWNHMYYTGAAFVSDSVLPHLVLDHGWLYYMFTITTVVELIACIFILLVSMIRTTQKHMLYNYFVLLAVVTIPFLGFIVSISGVVGSFDATPISVAFAIGLFAVSIAGKHVFDVADVVGGNILNNLDNAIIILNNEDGFEYANARAKNLFPVLKHYKRGEIIKEHEISVLFDNERREDVKLCNRHFDVSVNTVQAGAKNETVGRAVILFDVTDNNIQLDKMKNLIEEKDNANRSKSAFLANVSHEIRTPITDIMGLSEVLLRDYASKETEEYLYDIKNSSTTLLNLVNDILDYSQIEAGKMEIKEDRFDMKHLLSELVNVYKFRCSRKDISFEYLIDPGIPKFLVADAVRIKQIIINIMSNAVKYTSEGYVKLKVGYKNRGEFDLDLLVAIEDTGIGIRPEDWGKVFEGSVRSDMRRNQNVEGTGLGLNITKQLIELMGGVINFKSEFGKGTVFSTVIPVRVSADSIDTIGIIESDSAKEKVFRAYFTAPSAKVLIVDDTLTNIVVIKQLMKDTKVQVTTATSGQKCLDLVSNEHFDIIFLDHRMPGMDGLETFSRLRRIEGNGNRVPVVMLTANASLESRDFYVSRGFTDFLAKPVSSEALVNMLYKYLPEYMIIRNDLQ